MLKITSQSFKSNPQITKTSFESLQVVLNNKSLGFHQLPRREELWKSCQNLGAKLRSDFKKMIVLGIGGSSLGGKVIKEALKNKSDRSILFCENIDPLEVDSILKSIQGELASVCWVIISKSGNTIETLTQSDYINQYYSKQNLNWPKQCVVITEAKLSPLSEFANKYNLPSLEIPIDVGGRFSVLSPVGMLPAAFMGLDLEAFRQGAKLALEDKEKISDFATQTEMSFQRQEWITLFWSYSQSLRDFGFWIQQLWAESLGKKLNRMGVSAPRASTPMPCLGPADQHSILQQVADGYKDKFVVFMRNEESESSGNIIEKTLFSNGDIMLGKKLGELLRAEAQATQLGLDQNEISNISLIIPKLSEFELGYLFMFFELVVATLGENMNINAFDQPGVETGKIIAKNILSGKE